MKRPTLPDIAGLQAAAAKYKKHPGMTHMPPQPVPPALKAFGDYVDKVASGGYIRDGVDRYLNAFHAMGAQYRGEGMTPEQSRAANDALADFIPGVGLALSVGRKGLGKGIRIADDMPMVPKDTYGIEHRPMGIEQGAAPLHDLAQSFPDDIYSRHALQYYGSGDPREKSVLRILQSLRGKPDAQVTIYRGVPNDAPGVINPGDWVTLDRSVAADYGPQVIEMKVPARDITSWADSLLEFGYHPKK